VEFIKQSLDAIEIDFVGKRYIAGTISAILVAISVVLFLVVGPNFGIDFTGGTEIHLKFDNPVDIGDVRSALAELELGDDAVQALGAEGDYEFAVRIQDSNFGMEDLGNAVRGGLEATFGPDWIESMDANAEVGARFTIYYTGDQIEPADVGKALRGITGVTVQRGREDNQVVVIAPGLAQQIQKEIATVMGARTFEVLSIDAVGPKVGKELQRQGFSAMAWALGLVLLYVAFRFDIGFAPGAILALAHDVTLTVGIFIIAQLDFNLPMIGALLTIVGYSLNDTIVIYDRIRENRDRYRRKDVAELINVSINETLTRTVATSVTTILAITMLMVLGGPMIRNFAFAMFLGIIFGTYSTVFVASPMILIMEDVKPFLAGLLASPGGTSKDDGGPPADDEDDDPAARAALSESEKRRRERAEKERHPSRS
jgi:preprotein translocase subunit SecF